ncbi:rna-directed dna polymerase from mobile element jockey-like [Limosa lapponica baueri]|uniref:Rna-directed dna polymerase from mobile element jockey-like n=1 Tax=Limosa lapponica baueri TaxID=1758121 RepID=A0A2I0TR73_LIMLA|nr:rna-directed dna polymerase from mobile element jockey-like [Limosa lapponica baueri]
MASLVEQGAFDGKKRRVYHLWKKGQATQEEYRDLMKLYREKIRKAKAQLELNLANDIRDNKKSCYKYLTNKKRARGSLHPLLDAGGNIATKDEEKAEKLNAFFASVLNSQTSYPQDVQPSELEDKGEEQNNPPITQEEVVNDLLLHLDMHKSLGPDGIHPSTQGAGRRAHQASLHHLSTILVNRGGTR